MFAKVYGLVIASLLLGACGENALQRQSDPYANYHNDNLRPYNADTTPGERPKEAPVSFDKTEACQEPLVLTVQDANKEGALEFTAGEKKSALLVIESRLPEFMNDENGQQQKVTWNVSTTLKPEGSEFEQVKKDDKSATYKFTYTPSEESAPGVELLYLRYDFRLPKGCASFNMNPEVSLVIKEKTETAKKSGAKK